MGKGKIDEIYCWGGSGRTRNWGCGRTFQVRTHVRGKASATGAKPLRGLDGDKEVGEGEVDFSNLMNLEIRIGMLNT